MLEQGGRVYDEAVPRSIEVQQLATAARAEVQEDERYRESSD